jgi:uncharacterized protein (TIRG00374 family)
VSYFKQNIKYVINYRKNIFLVISISVLFHFLAFWGIFFLFKSFGVQIDFCDCALIAAIGGISSLIPFSLNGIGIVDGTYVYVAHLLGIGYEQSVMFAFSYRLLSLPLSILCGAIYIFDYRK